MGKYVATEVVKLMIKNGIKEAKANVLQLGITFKENCSDIRNSHAVDVVYGLQEFGCHVDVFDPIADPEEVKKEYGIVSKNNLTELQEKSYDAVVLAVPHRELMNFDIEKYKKSNGIVFDIKAVMPKDKSDGRL